MLIALVYSWGSGHAIGSFVAAGVSLVLLIIVEGWVAKEPVSSCIHAIPYQLVLMASFHTVVPSWCHPQSCCRALLSLHHLPWLLL